MLTFKRMLRVVFVCALTSQKKRDLSDDKFFFLFPRSREKCKRVIEKALSRREEGGRQKFGLVKKWQRVQISIQSDRYKV